MPSQFVGDMLGADEALLSYHIGFEDDAVYLWVVRPGRLDWRRLDLTPEDLPTGQAPAQALDLARAAGVSCFSACRGCALRRLLLPDEETY